MGRPTVIRWPDIRRDYVEGVPSENEGDTLTITMDELAVKYGVSSTAVKLKASKEKWTELRTAFHAQVQLKRMEFRARELAKRRAHIDERAYALAITALNLIAKGLRAIETTGKRIDPLTMARYVAAIRGAQEAALRATGETQDHHTTGSEVIPGTAVARLVQVIYEKSAPIAERVRDYE